MLETLCENCKKNTVCSPGTKARGQRCEVACMWPLKCGCGTTEDVKVVMLTTSTSRMTFSICRECFCFQYSDSKDQWDNLKLPEFTPDGKGYIIKSASTIVRDYIKEGKLDVTKRLYQKTIRKIEDELDVSWWDITTTVKKIRKEQRIRVS